MKRVIKKRGAKTHKKTTQDFKGVEKAGPTPPGSCKKGQRHEKMKKNEKSKKK